MYSVSLCLSVVSPLRECRRVLFSPWFADYQAVLPFFNLPLAGRAIWFSHWMYGCIDHLCRRTRFLSMIA